jgi:serine/threonine protein kinase
MTRCTHEDDPAVADLVEELTARLKAGEAVDLDACLARHPEHAEELRRLFPTLRMLAEMSLSGSGGGPAAAAEAVPGTLGDFRLLREVGRGGMGVVYEAEQISLGRRVALKVLPFAAALDPRHLQRFKAEAQAAAQLHHANIVPVYFVGCERGVHFYAMQLIEGRSLADVIGELRPGAAGPDGRGVRPPTSTGDARPEADTAPVAVLTGGRSVRGREFFRAVARLGVQAAEALDHAHQMGVTHRDVKPANLLLDAAGRLWVADFGLARCGGDPGLTGTGDMVGTLRYMSPEQALARRALVDHRSDVYALGVTLYEALTLEPAFPGRDREELLRQIAAGDPRPPRRLNPAVPVELETVVLKAMAREPEGRYATAQELADDLRRFLEGRPILAARPALRERASRWGRRHPTAVAVAAAVLGVALAALLVTTALLLREQGRTKAREAEALKQRQRAETNLKRALNGVAAMLAKLDPKQPGAPRPDGDELHRALIAEGMDFFQSFIDENNPDPAVRYQSSLAYENEACVYASQWDLDNTQAMLRKAIGLLEGLAAEYPSEELYLKELLRARYLLALMYKSFGRPAEARAEYRRTAELCHAPVPDAWDGALNNCAWILVDCPDDMVRDPSLAVSLAERALARAPERPEYWNTLGVARYRAGEWGQAVAALERSVELGEGGTPYDWFFLAMARWRQGDAQQAGAWYDKAARRMDRQGSPDEALLRYRAEAKALLGR